MDVYQRRRLVAVLAIVLVLVLAVVAIAGGGDDEGEPIEAVTGASTPGVGTPLSKSEFIAEGDQTCDEIATAIANIDTSDAQEAADQELDYTKSLLSQLRSLTPPEEDHATLDQFFSSLEDLVDALKQNSDAIASGDTTAQSEAATEIDQAKSGFLAAAQDYGFKDCGEEGEPSPSGTGAPAGTGGTAPVTPVTPSTTPAVTPTTTPSTTPPSGGTGTGGGTGGGGGGGGGGGSSGGIGPG
jgi:hypothetical protein